LTGEKIPFAASDRIWQADRQLSLSITGLWFAVASCPIKEDFMQASLIFILALGEIATASLPPLPVIHCANPHSYYEANVNLAEPEALRIRKHLEKVENDLRRHPPLGLTPKQMQARLERLDDLHDYRINGKFPHNPQPGTLSPYFIDAEGVPCAVGYLIIASGNSELSNSIARTQNQAYIGEIRDPSLADWARKSGLTLEECERIQPGYGGMDYLHILTLQTDFQGKPWVAAGEAFCPHCHAIASWDEGGWKIQVEGAGFKGMCIVGNEPLIVLPGALLWRGQKQSEAGLEGSFFSSSCPSGGQSAWLGGDHGLLHYRIPPTEGGPRLLETVHAGIHSIPSDSVLALAQTATSLWVGTSQGLATRTLAGGSWAIFDSSTLGSVNVSGIQVGGDSSIWVGLEGRRHREDWVPQNFSERGLVWKAGKQGWKKFRTKNSPLPSDTVFAIASSGGPSVWLTGPGGLFSFTPPGTLSKVADLPAPGVTGLSVDGGGHLLLALVDRGVWRLEKTEWIYLSNPIVGVLPAQEGVPRTTAPGIFFRSAKRPPTASDLFSVSGRESGSIAGAGMYVRPNSAGQSLWSR
jgi:hypothetical protein